ncbi:MULTISPECIES: hypothetical protein [Streptomyces]|uniref:Type VII secretion system (Wss) protein ESAT-6 n=1 Tax=Streptomyces spororaveus TaxID=284039 RepID=A0ABQ3TJ67_9ACTN|nr:MULTISPECIES: hypothetical protein [Streptomyces]MCM9079218.1 hypothetical protein [Streptomyces spororaveus]MCX5306360.1 hypothetical protein [Streptomyces sp. NBC_00160]GHI80453.1 hypothetical protein Sspor_60140 [Streptomyces spororaveus]
MIDEPGQASDQQVEMRLNSGPPLGPYAPGVTPTPGPYAPGVTPTPGPYAPGVTAPSVVPYAPGVTPPSSNLFTPGGSPDFVSTPAQKKAAADTIQNELKHATKTAAEHADDATSTARKGFEGWETAAGLQKVADTWDQQVKTLMGRLAGEETALRGAAGSIAGNDINLGNRFASHSQLNGI